jgi:uncharacterized protein (DUF1015 family)
MADLFNAFDGSLTIQPYNRLIRASEKNSVDILRELEATYRIGAINFQDLKMEKLARNKIRALISDSRAKNFASFGVYFKNSPNRYFLLTSRNPVQPGDWDVEILDNTIIRPIVGIRAEAYAEQLDYESDDNETYDRVKSGEFAMAFLQNPVSIDTVLALSDANRLLPYRTTQFYPRVMCGICIFSYRYSNIKIL